MNSREKILASVKANQPEYLALPDIDKFNREETNLLQKYMSILEAIGGKAYVVADYGNIVEIVHSLFPDAKRTVTTCNELAGFEKIDKDEDPHLLESIDLAIVKAHLGVAENGSLWVTEDYLVQRALPFICQYLAAVVRKEDIVATMHEAYNIIAGADYGFGVFIAGPSKTADIEQSLVLGAHGPKGMTVFILGAAE